MLLTSYLDARPGLLSSGGDKVSTSRGSSIPHSGDLWARGSYQELEDALEDLTLAQRQRLWRGFIWQPDRRRRSVQLIYRQKQAKQLDKDLREVSSRMPRRIRVPGYVRQNWQDGLNSQFARPSKSSDDPVRQ